MNAMTYNKQLIPGKFRNDFLMQLLALQAIAIKKARLRLTPNEITLLSALYLTNSITGDPFHNIKELQQLFAPWQPSYIHKKLNKLASLGLIQQILPGFKSIFYVVSPEGIKILKLLNATMLKTYTEFLNNPPKRKYISLKRKYMQ